MYSGEIVFVSGSAHLDVLARVTGDSAAIDKIGEVEIEIGGTGCNIALDFAYMGLKPRLLTAMNPKSPFTELISSHLKSHGVAPYVAPYNGNATPIFSAHILNGEMYSAVSSMPVETVEFSEEMIVDAMTGAHCVVIECNLSTAMLTRTAKIANDMDLPVFAAAVSEEKSLKLAKISKNVRLSAVFMNHNELLYFAKKTGIASHAAQAPEHVSEFLSCPVIVTCGKNGVIVIDQKTRTDIPASSIENINTSLGAGDALMSSSVANFIFNGCDLAESVRQGTSFATQIINRSNCNFGNKKTVEKTISTLRELATRDGLTGLFNRRSGEKMILAIMNDIKEKTATIFSVLMIDIDHFKRVNDTHGHHTGDEIIKMVAAKMKDSVREDDIVCRWGGEEFVCVLRNMGIESAFNIAERIRSSIENEIMPKAGNVTVSIGASEWSTDRSMEDIITSADFALYEAKSTGRNRVFLSRNATIQT